MPNGINTPKISAIMHLPKELPYAQTKFYGIVKNILQQFDQMLELIILDQSLDEQIENEISQMNTEGNNIVFRITIMDYFKITWSRYNTLWRIFTDNIYGQ